MASVHYLLKETEIQKLNSRSQTRLKLKTSKQIGTEETLQNIGVNCLETDVMI